MLTRIPGMNNLMQAIAEAPGELLHSPVLILLATLLHASIFLLDTATLWVMLQVVGIPLSI